MALLTESERRSAPEAACPGVFRNRGTDVRERGVRRAALSADYERQNGVIDERS